MESQVSYLQIQENQQGKNDWSCSLATYFGNRFMFERKSNDK